MRGCKRKCNFWRYHHGVSVQKANANANTDANADVDANANAEANANNDADANAEVVGKDIFVNREPKQNL